MINDEYVQRTPPDYNPEIAQSVAPLGVENIPEVIGPTVDVDAASAAISAVAAGQPLELSGDVDTVMNGKLASPGPTSVEAKLDAPAASGAGPMIRAGHLIGN